VADADGRRCERQRQSERSDEQSTPWREPDGCRLNWRLNDPAVRGIWKSEPDVGRVAHGVPARVDRLRALGNAVVPQIPEIIGRAIMRAQ
jgi:DNA (cytosine-5)-methyltransferase 1